MYRGRSTVYGAGIRFRGFPDMARPRSRATVNSFSGHNSHAPRKQTQDLPIAYDLYISLEEVASGVTKKINILRKVLNPNNRTTHFEKKILTIDIKPGWKQGTKITFPRAGDQSPTTIPADITVIIKDKDHPIFKRHGDDIMYTATITLEQVSSKKHGESRIDLNWLYLCFFRRYVEEYSRFQPLITDANAIYKLIISFAQVP